MTSITPIAAAQLADQRVYDVALRDGSTVRLRAVRPDDQAGLREFRTRLSALNGRPEEQSIPDLSDASLNALVTTESQTRFALVAESRGRIVALAQCVRRAAEPDLADVAFVVEPQLQGRGIGTALLERLAQIAYAQDISAFEGDVRADNQAMLRVFADSGFAATRRLEGNLVRMRLSLEPTPHFQQSAARRAAQSAAASIGIFFAPRCVAVIGASRHPHKIGSVVYRNLRSCGFPGRVLPVSAAAAEVDGVPAFARICDVGEPMDLAVIAVPAERVESVIDDCIAAHVRGVIILTAGFAETGVQGKRRERAIVEKLQVAGVRLIGPNCIGVINTDPAAPLNATFHPQMPPPGNVAMLSQSGALGVTILEYARQLNLGLSTFVSVGNKADISSNDLLQYWQHDPKTDVILLYLESFGNPRKFSRIAREVGRRKPIVVVKSGRSKAGARAAASHTGALAGSDRAVDALFRQCGVIRTNTLEEMFDVASLLAHQPAPKGRRVAILTNAGGPGIMAADACEALGLELPVLGDKTIKALQAFLPTEASVGNPVDMIATANAEHFRCAIPVLLADESVDSLIVLYVPALRVTATDIARAIVESVPRECGKTVLASFMSAHGSPAQIAPIPSFRFPEAAAAALARAAAYGQWRSKPAGEVVRFDDLQADELRQIIDESLAPPPPRCGGGWLRPDEAQCLLRAAGIHVIKAHVAQSPGEACEAARRIGYPIALKAVGPTIVHKTDVGGVRLGLTDEAALLRAYQDFNQRLGEALTAVMVQEMSPGGVEILIGATHDPLFGHVIAYGSGGTMVELLQDVTLRLHPLTNLDAQDMLNEVKGTAMLRGFRGAPPADESSVREMLLRLSALLEICPEITELDINPARVFKYGALVLDARVQVAHHAAPQPFFAHSIPADCLSHQ